MKAAEGDAVTLLSVHLICDAPMMQSQRGAFRAYAEIASLSNLLKI